MRLQETEPLTFPTLGWLVGAWIERHCIVPDRYLSEESAAAQVRDPFRLYSSQLLYLVHHYRTKTTAERGQLATAFTYRMSMRVAPQKIGKGPLRAAHICAEAVGPVLFDGFGRPGDVYACEQHGCPCGWEYRYEAGEPKGRRWGSGTSPTPLIQLTATSEEQTDNVWKLLRPMIDEGPLARVIPRTGEDLIRLPGGGDAHTVTSNAQSRLGARVTFVPQDEVGLYVVSNGMVKVALTQHRGVAGMGGRAAMDTNGWDPAENSLAQRIDEANLADVLVDFREAPPGLSYGDRRERRRIHRHVYGDAAKERGGHVDLDGIEGDAQGLIAIGEQAMAARFFGNMLVQGKGSWLPDGLYASAKRLNGMPADGTPICLGFDGSETNDWTCLKAETAEGYQFTPRFGPDQLPTRWNPEDHGGKIPRALVDAAVDEVHTRFRVKRFYCDPRDWQTAIGQWFLKYGTASEWPTNQVGRTWMALKRYVTDLGTGDVTHDGDPVTATHVANARKTPMPGQKYLLAKPAGADHQKIDDAMAAVLVHEAVQDALEAGWDPDPQPEYAYVF